MRIGFDAKRAFVNSTGLGNYSRDIIRGFNEYYPENEYFLFTTKKETSLLENEYLKNIVFPKYVSKLGKAFWRTLSIPSKINELNLDIYHGLSNELPLNINKSKVKKVVTIHDLIFIKFPQLYPFIDRKIYHRKFFHACKNADIIIATSEQTKLDIIRYFGINEKKIQVVYQSYNTVFDKRFNQEEKLKILKKYNLPKRYILTVGTIEKRKNTLNVVKALYYYNLDIKYVLIGKRTPYCRKMEEYAREKGISDRIIILKNVKNEDLPLIYQNSEIFIYPSIYEGFGIPILEAFASETPVITADHGSTAEIAGTAAVQTEVHNPKAIGIAIKTLLESYELKEILKKDGLERLKLFDRKAVINKLNNIYKSL
ncbi:MAG: glycosyltransferase family 1 protein [Bacteroidales bacterium]|jgi:glycosyltransferase involved in cell wall biosynthesis|nr:glycosyltransferase family 1 protein [Bacteroidales bacterium]HOL97830.1 glycosyltransferase family 1 protein [Bacteroidales bacterium]HOM35879.1 glycosyltransferase family 1 protein [Bacteroidales bacterium]HPD23202.1 glycosyltransferase family 1 protein [Bacteroidales bacterium]HRS99206.1 glycosyltransferase family 1 protein [Bacteroidales bacterium]